MTGFSVIPQIEQGYQDPVAQFGLVNWAIACFAKESDRHRDARPAAHPVVILLALIALLMPSVAPAAITQLVLETRQPLPVEAPNRDGVLYERLRGYARGELDPADPHNAVIPLLEKAPRNAAGRVEYRVELEIHQPVDPDHSNGTLLYHVVNRGRGGRSTLSLRAQGFTIVSSGWQPGLTADGILLTADLPVAQEGGASMVGLSREEFRGDSTFVGRLQYPAATLERAQATLTVRLRERDRRVPIDSWRYLDERQIEITTPGEPYSPGSLYEFIYPATEPVVVAVGFAATRDLNSFLRSGVAAEDGLVNPLVRERGPQIERTMARGNSQSGRMLRHFLYLGFNEDEEGRQVFDGVLVTVPGSRKTWMHTAFAKPGWWSKQHAHHLQPGDQFPFAYTTITDPLTGVTDGILARCNDSNTCPKVLHLDGEFELWGARGSLLVTDGDPLGPQDVEIPPNVRLYMVAGTPHGGAGTIVPAHSERGRCKHQLNPNGSWPVSRALLIALSEWITTGREPPPSNYGSVENGLLVPSDQASTGFPEIPGIIYTGIYNSLRVTDYSVEPPAEGEEYGVLVPKVDTDGNSIAGIRLPALVVPIATYTGWNLQTSGYAEDEMCGAQGSYIPFADTREERIAQGDPRLSIQERYRSRSDYVAQVREAADRLVARRLLLPDEATTIVTQAEQIALPLD